MAEWNTYVMGSLSGWMVALFWTALERIWLNYVGFLAFDVRIDWDLE